MTEVSIDVADLSYDFNPPPHPSILSAIYDGGGTWQGYGNTGVGAWLRDETANTYDASYGATGSNKFSDLRLGRIFTWNKVFQFSGDGPKRYGFRFLYNPNTIGGRQSVGQDFIPDPMDRIGAMLPMGLEAIQFEILLNRMPEVQGGAKAGDFAPSIDETTLGHIKERGTHYDLDYLYRIANGYHNTTARQGTGDIGILLPNPVELVIGPFRSRGSVISLAATDKMFSADMVPMLTFVQITFQRYLSFSPSEDELERLRSSGVYYSGEDDPYGSPIVDEEGNPIEGTEGSEGSTGENEGEPDTGNSKQAPAGKDNRSKNYVTQGWKYTPSGRQHGAWDYGRFTTGSKVYCCRAGEVRYAGWDYKSGYGNYVKIQVGNITCYYAHLSQVSPELKVGQQIPVGHYLGRSGSTGNSTGPHLHYEERLDGNQHSRRPQWADRIKGDAAEGAKGGP